MIFRIAIFASFFVLFPKYLFSLNDYTSYSSNGIFKNFLGIKLGISIEDLRTYLDTCKLLTYGETLSRHPLNIELDNSRNKVKHVFGTVNFEENKKRISAVDITFYNGILYSLTGELDHSDYSEILREFDLAFGLHTNNTIKYDAFHSKHSIVTHMWVFQDHVIYLDSVSQNSDSHTLTIENTDNIFQKGIIDNSALVETSFEEIDELKHEIYARRGFYFDNEELSDMFSQHYWYVPKSDKINLKFSKIERINLLKLEKERAKEIDRRKIAIKWLRTLKNEIRTKGVTYPLDESNYFRKYYSGSLSDYEQQSDLLFENRLELILEILENVNITNKALDVSHIEFETTFYQVLQDVTYRITFTWNKVTIGVDSKTHLDIGDWNEEWVFQVIGNRLKLIQHMEAG